MGVITSASSQFPGSASSSSLISHIPFASIMIRSGLTSFWKARNASSVTESSSSILRTTNLLSPSLIISMLSSPSSHTTIRVVSPSLNCPSSIVCLMKLVFPLSKNPVNKYTGRGLFANIFILRIILQVLIHQFRHRLHTVFRCNPHCLP